MWFGRTSGAPSRRWAEVTGLWWCDDGLGLEAVCVLGRRAGRDGGLVVVAADQGSRPLRACTEPGAIHNETQNVSAGSLLGHFYNDQRVLDGDAFYVRTR